MPACGNRGKKRLLNTYSKIRKVFLFVCFGFFFKTSLFGNNMVEAQSFHNYGKCGVLLWECTHKLTKRAQIGGTKIDNAHM